MDKQNVGDFLRVYKDVLNVMGIDIARSELQGRYFVFRRNGIYANGYDFFMEVKDEADLVDVIISELSYDMHTEIGIEDLDLPECDKRNLAELIDEYRKDS